MKVKVKKLSEQGVIPYKTHLEDFCYDCVATSCEEIAPNVYKYGLGLAFQIDRNESHDLKGVLISSVDNTYYQAIDLKNKNVNISIDFRPRSSVWKTGMVLSNSQGTIDEIYTGMVSAVFYHVLPNMPKYEVGDRIGQIKLGFTLPIEFLEVEQLDETARGDGGFGSTGE